MKKLLAIAALLTAVAAPMAAQAHVDVGIGINLGPPVVYGGYRYAYAPPPPVYYSPAPVYYEAPRVYYRGYYRDRAWCPDEDRGYYRHGWHHEGWHDRDHDRWDRR